MMPTDQDQPISKTTQVGRYQAEGSSLVSPMSAPVAWKLTHMKGRHAEGIENR